MKQSKIVDKDTTLLDALNAFYARFEQNAIGAISLVPTAPDAPVPSIAAADVRKTGGGHNPIYINGAEVERVDIVKFLGVTITNG
eukprot:g28197.t1